ncbi:hypothetical protein ABZV91_14790 [Nocardia sp. NPDC004568]
MALLEALYAELCVLREADDPMTREVEDLRTELLSETVSGS